MNLYEAPVSLDPRVVRNVKDLTLAKQLYEGLMRFDQQNQLAPALASEVIIAEDGRTYTFTLREAYWSNNERITSYDFVRSVQELLSPSFSTSYAFMLFPIKNAKSAKLGQCSVDEVGIYAIDQTTLTIELEQVTPYFLELTAFPTFFPVHNRPDVYSGPFKIKKMQQDYALVIEKNPTYWDKESVLLQEISFSIIADPVTEWHLFQKGELDWVGQPLSESIPNEILQQQSKVDSYPVMGTCWLAFNVDVFPLQHTKIRQAMSLALCRNQLITHILQGGQQVATSPVPPYMSTNMAHFLDDNQIQAKVLLQEACRELSIDSLPSLTLTLPTSQRNRQLAEVIQEQLYNSLGIEIHLELIENHLYRHKIKNGDFIIGFSQWIADFNDPIAFLEIFSQPRSYGINVTNWLSDYYTSLIVEAAEEKDRTKRSLLLQKAETFLMEAMPIAPLYHYAFNYIKKEYVQGVLLFPSGLADFKYTRLSPVN